MRATTVMSVLLIGILATSLPAQAESSVKNTEHLVVAIIKSTDDDQYLKPIQKWFLKIYTEAFSRMDISLQYYVLPPKRASLYSDEGILDGELSRVYDYDTTHPNLIRVEEHHLTSVFSAFSTNTAIKLNGWKSLKNTGYRIGYRLGLKKTGEELTKIIPLEYLVEAASIESGLRMLLMGRTDIFIEPEDGVFDYLNSYKYLEEKQKKANEIHKVGVMEMVTSHMWLHKKHRELAPRLSVILRDMKREALFELYLEQLQLNSQLIKW